MSSSNLRPNRRAPYYPANIFPGHVMCEYVCKYMYISRPSLDGLLARGAVARGCGTAARREPDTQKVHSHSLPAKSRGTRAAAPPVCSVSATPCRVTPPLGTRAPSYDGEYKWPFGHVARVGGQGAQTLIGPSQSPSRSLETAPPV